MALTVPTSADLEGYKDDLSNDEAIERAADLFVMATGVKDTPTDPLEARLVKHAILEMAWYLQTAHEDAEATFSPFTSERIGSYSYQKASAAVSASKSTGIAAFDAAVDYFTDQALGGGVISMQAENVFTPGYHEPCLTGGPGHDPSSLAYRTPDAYRYGEVVINPYPPVTIEVSEDGSVWILGQDNTGAYPGTDVPL